VSNHVKHFLDDDDTKDRFYQNLICSKSLDNFGNTIINLNQYERFDHGKNIFKLETILNKSFLHVISETMATSYYPCVSEKFLYSVLTKGLFLAYAPPHWHRFIEKYYGFRLYRNLFNYEFDLIQNPIERLVALADMISKFSCLNSDEWHDLYLLELDNINYNYEWYHSGNYINKLKECETNI
jgi:hypothetical protein